MQKSVNPNRDFEAAGQTASLYGQERFLNHEHLLALLVPSENEWRGEMERFLKTRQIAFDTAESFDEVESALNQAHPEVIVTAANLPDGTWQDIAGLVKKSQAPTGIVVVADRRDSRPYLSAAIDCGVFDFIHPPFVSETQACIIRVAARETLRKRKDQASQSFAQARVGHPYKLQA